MYVILNKTNKCILYINILKSMDWTEAGGSQNKANDLMIKKEKLQNKRHKGVYFPHKTRPEHKHTADPAPPPPPPPPTHPLTTLATTTNNNTNNNNNTNTNNTNTNNIYTANPNVLLTRRLCLHPNDPGIHSGKLHVSKDRLSEI